MAPTERDEGAGMAKERAPKDAGERDTARRAAPLPAAAFHILLALSDGPRHGYAIMREVEDLSDGAVTMGPGTLYGSIKQMLEDGWIEEVTGRAAADDERRRYYRLTREGRDAARQEMARMSALLTHARTTSLRSNEG